MLLCNKYKYCNVLIVFNFKFQFFKYCNYWTLFVGVSYVLLLQSKNVSKLEMLVKIKVTSVLKVSNTDIYRKDVFSFEKFETTKKTFEKIFFCKIKNYKVYMYRVQIKFFKCTE